MKKLIKSKRAVSLLCLYASIQSSTTDWKTKRVNITACYETMTRNYKTKHKLFTPFMSTHLCGTLPHFNHLKQGCILHPVLLMMAIHPANTRDPPCSPTSGLVPKRLLPFPGCLLGRKILNGQWKCYCVIITLSRARMH